MYWFTLCSSHKGTSTKALEEIGGLGPELAEDHSTSLMMNADGWRGVHAINAIAHGAGPQTFGDLATQEFQWSRSLVAILLRHTPSYLHKLPLRLKLQFVFCQLWYPLFSVFMLLMYCHPLAALLLDSNMVGVTFLDFSLHISPIWIILSVMAFWWRRQRWLRPVDVKMPSWEGALFLFARWPWSLMGSVAAVRDWALGSAREYRVTPKGRTAAQPLPFRVLAPYAMLSAASGLPVLFLSHIKIALGFYVFAAFNSILYAVLLLIIIILHRRENLSATDLSEERDNRDYRQVVAIASGALAISAGNLDASR